MIGSVLNGAIRLEAPVGRAAAAAASPISSPGSASCGSDKAILGTISLDLFAVLLGGATALMPIYAARHPAYRALGARRAARGAGGGRAGDDRGAGAAQHHPAGRDADAAGGDRLRPRHAGLRAVAQHGADAGGAGGDGRRRHGERGDPHVAGAAPHARRDARAGRGGELPLHQRLEPARRVRERHDRGARSARCRRRCWAGSARSRWRCSGCGSSRSSASVERLE